MWYYKVFLLITLGWAVLFESPHTLASTLFPEDKWQRIYPPESAGFSSEKLKIANNLFNEMSSNAFIVVLNGRLLVAWGNIKEKLDVYSVRKSFLNALLGIHVSNGSINLLTTLGELGIDDKGGLTEQEKTARIIDLIRSRSGVYHKAAYETKKIKRYRPRRDQFKPDRHWFYNNWDFNTLGGIFQKIVKKSLFLEFKHRIADPVQMQDFIVTDGRFHKENVSWFPAYPFRMSARDMARFGLLFANWGRWKQQQIVPKKWVEKSTRTYSITNRKNRKSVGYGYMWWTTRSGKRHFKNRLGDDAFSARGNGGQYIIIAPSLDIVVVHTANWKLTGQKARAGKVGKLLKAVLDAKIEK